MSTNALPIQPANITRNITDLKRELNRRINFEKSRNEYDEPWAQWILKIAPWAVSGNDGVVDFAPYHREFWEWVMSLTPEETVETFMSIVFRGGGKSTNAELATTYVATEGICHYGLYVCGTQKQADSHLLTISQLFQAKSTAEYYPSLGKIRLDEHNRSLGWNASRISSEIGFTIDAVGLDMAFRGFKIDFQRPDWLVIDDVDSIRDSQDTTLKKEATLSQNILSSLATNAKVLAIQNLIKRGSIFHRAWVGDSDILPKKVISGPHPALRDLRTHTNSEGVVSITHGTPTWRGFGIKEAQAIMDLIGPTGFFIECQHEIDLARASFLGDIWRQSTHMVDMFSIPMSWRIDRSFDWGFAKPWACIWWAESDGSPHSVLVDGVYEERITSAGTLFAVGELYGWNGHDNQGSRDNNSEIAKKINQYEKGVSWGSRVKVGPADSSIFVRKGGKSIADDMRSGGVGWTKSDRSADSRINGAALVRERLVSASMGAVDGPGLYFWKNCFHIGRTFPLLPESIRKDGDVDTDSEDHAWDAVRYRLYQKPSLFRSLNMRR